MVQTLYGLIALLLVMIAVLNFHRAVRGTEQRMMMNEIATEVTSVGAELLDEIEKYPYDPAAPPITTSEALSDRDALRDASTFGVGSTCDPDNNYAGCLFINDFHGKTATRTRERTYEGTTYVVSYIIEDIEVRYVSETPPHDPVASGTTTFAKEVILTISCPDLYLGSRNNPVTVKMSRVFTYPSL